MLQPGKGKLGAPGQLGAPSNCLFCLSCSDGPAQAQVTYLVPGSCNAAPLCDQAVSSSLDSQCRRAPFPATIRRTGGGNLRQILKS